MLYLSSHQYPVLPGHRRVRTRWARGAGAGYTVNCALPPGQGDADYGAVFHELFLPGARRVPPRHLIIVSAGFDAHARDPLADMLRHRARLRGDVHALAELARSHCGGKLVLLLEGGYDLEALAQSVRACLEVMTGARREDFPRGAGHASRRRVVARHARGAAARRARPAGRRRLEPATLAAGSAGAPAWRARGARAGDLYRRAAGADLPRRVDLARRARCAC